MKKRNSEANHLEGEYLRRVREALAGGDAAAADDVLQSVREHIEEELADIGGDEVTLVQMATVLEKLGPPESYVDDQPDAAPPVDATFAPIAGSPAARQPLTINVCFADAMKLYKQNLVILVVAAFLFDIISVFTLLILAAPLWGGLAIMMINARRRPDRPSPRPSTARRSNWRDGAARQNGRLA